MASASGIALLAKNRIDDLPNELLEMVMIMALSNGVTGLHAFVCAYSGARALFEKRPRTFLLGAIQCSNMELQLQKMYCTIISIRERHKYATADEDISLYINLRLRDQSTTIDLDLSVTPSFNTIDMLEDATKIYDSIKLAENSFVEIQLHENFSKLQPHAIEIESRTSATELYRIRRALWRLRLYYEAYYEPYIALAVRERENMQLPDFTTKIPSKLVTSNGLWGLSEEAKNKHNHSQGRFFWHLTVWELEELECVWFHLSYQVFNLWRHRCPFCRRNPLPDRYVAHIRECQNPRVTPTYYPGGASRVIRFCPNFVQACVMFRDLVEVRPGTMGRDLSKWPEGPAREPSAGFTFRFEHNSCFVPDTSIGRPPLVKLLQWGYCIWDRQRLEAYQLVDSLDRKSLARLDLWDPDYQLMLANNRYDSDLDE